MPPRRLKQLIENTTQPTLNLTVKYRYISITFNIFPMLSPSFVLLLLNIVPHPLANLAPSAASGELHQLGILGIRHHRGPLQGLQDLQRVLCRGQAQRQEMLGHQDVVVLFQARQAVVDGCRLSWRVKLIHTRVRFTS